MAVGTPKSAKNSKVRIGSTVLWAANWKVDPETNFADTTSFEDGGYETQVACISKCMVEVSGFLDSGQDMFAAPPNINPGQRLTNTGATTRVKLYLDGTSGAFWDFPYLDVLSVSITADVKQEVKYSFRGKAQGSFSAPSGTW